MLVGARQTCYINAYPFPQKDQNIIDKPKFCTFRVKGKSVLRRCDHGIYMKEKCKATTLFNYNSSLRKTYLNNYRHYR